MPQHPYRSALYIPASKARALEKARSLACDAILFDLEDAVAPAEKQGARVTLAAALGEGGYGARKRIVRINGLDTPWGAEDARAAVQMGCDAVLLPKVNGLGDIDALAQITGDLPVWCMMETPVGVMNAGAITGHPLVAGIVMGTNDLAKDMGCRFRADRLPLMMALQACLMAAKAHNVVAVDGVYNAFKDVDGLRAECAQGRDLGFDGKSLIHPAQLDVANEVFAPTPEEAALAQRQIAAFEAAEAAGEGVAVVDGKIVENLHIVTARATLAKLDAITALETA